MALKQITAASTYPVTLAEAKLHCRVDSSADDTLITSLITAATEMAEQEVGRALMPQTWELTLDAFPPAFELTRTPVQSITSVKYYDGVGVEQTLAADQYTLDTSSADGYAYLVPAYGLDWPESRTQINAVAVRYLAGYATVPESIKQWIKLMIGAMYEHREAEGAMQTHTLGFADRLLGRHMVYS